MIMQMRKLHPRRRWPLALSSLAIGLLVGASAADSRGPNIIEDDDDAGNTPMTARPMVGNVSFEVLNLSGSLTGAAGGGGLTARKIQGDFQDLWLIYIADPDEFSASTVPGAGVATFDTRLFLFRPSGPGLLFADNSQGTLQTFLGNEASSGELKLSAPGVYCIGIVGSPGSPRADGDKQMFPVAEGDQTVAPTPDGLLKPLEGWSPFVGATGDYTIRFSGVKTIPIACQDGGDCYRANTTPGCADMSCCTVVGEIDPYCITTAWDLQCANLARDKCVSCGAPNSGDCKTPSVTPFCSDGACCTRVCDIDPACCIVAWDAGCVNAASELCEEPCDADCPQDFNDDGIRDGSDLGILLASWGLSGCTDLDRSGFTDGADLGLFLGSAQCSECGASESTGCFIPGNAPGCDNTTCCETVCDLDPACCQSAWDGACVEIAKSNCAPTCGSANAGLCLVPHPSPGCKDAPCCTAVCNVLPRCCTDFWDQNCVNYATLLPACQP